jgi:hypothetical protein
MEEPSKNIEEITQKWVEEAGIEQPSGDFVSSVMTAIEAKTAPQTRYKPLISVGGWSVVLAIFVTTIVVLLLFPIGNLGIFDITSYTNLADFKNPFAGLKVSKIMIYGIGFLALFIIEIPFLKRQFMN